MIAGGASFVNTLAGRV